MQCKFCEKESKGNRILCQACMVKVQRIRNKVASINYKGKKCQRCGVKFTSINQIAMFEFHHLKDKEFRIAGVLDRMSWDRIKKELDKCEMLCSNCHRTEHFELKDNGNVMGAIFENYRGKLDLSI